MKQRSRLAGLFVLVLALIGWLALAQHKRNKAQVELAEVLAGYEEVEAGGFADAARLNEFLARFDEVSDRAGGSPAGAVARFYRGTVLHRLGRTEEAIPVLEKVVVEVDGTTLEATASGMLANAYRAAGRGGDAISLLTDLVESADPWLPSSSAISVAATTSLITGSTSCAMSPSLSPASGRSRHLKDTGLKSMISSRPYLRSEMASFSRTSEVLMVPSTAQTSVQR